MSEVGQRSSKYVFYSTRKQRSMVTNVAEIQGMLEEEGV